MQIIRRPSWLLTGIAAMALSACSGGRSGDTPPPPSPPTAQNNWDQMIWDQGSWQ